MVNFLCRVCLYMTENGAFYRKIERIKYILELLVPEIRGFIDASTLVCCHCYYFMENIEKFRIKSLESTKIILDRQASAVIQKDNNNRVQHIYHPVPPTHAPKSVIEQNPNYNQYQRSHLPNNENFSRTTKTDSLKMLLSRPIEAHVPAQYLDSTPKDTEAEFLILNDINDFQTENDCYPLSQQDNEQFKHSELDNVKEKTARDELPAATNTSGAPLKQFPENEIIELDDDDDDDYDNPLDQNRPEKTCEVDGVVKTETLEENRGFFNIRNEQGFYVCQLCKKNYKTSRGLYLHTKVKHKDKLKFHYCNMCNFFSLWKSSMSRHLIMFHSTDPLKCYNCTFSTKLQCELDTHLRFCNKRLKLLTSKSNLRT